MTAAQELEQLPATGWLNYDTYVRNDPTGRHSLKDTVIPTMDDSRENLSSKDLNDLAMEKLAFYFEDFCSETSERKPGKFDYLVFFFDQCRRKRFIYQRYEQKLLAVFDDVLGNMKSESCFDEDYATDKVAESLRRHPLCHYVSGRRY
jgi:hypothetical protein